MAMALTAARLALMAARACATGGTDARPDLVRLAPEPEPRSLGAAAAALAALPKPLRLTCEVQDGVLTVRPVALPPDPPEPLGPLPEGVMRVSEHPEHQMMGFLHEQHGPDIEGLPVACLGVGETLRATVGEIRAWDRDYRYHEPAGRCCVLGMRAWHFPQPSHPELFRDVPAAVLEGAVAFLRFEPADDEEHHLWFLAPDSSPAVFCDDCDVRRATTRTRDRDQGYWRERHLCDACGWAEDVTPGVAVEWPESEALASFERDAGEEFLAGLAEGLARMAEKSGLPMPAPVAGFVERHVPR